MGYANIVNLPETMPYSRTRGIPWWSVPLETSRQAMRNLVDTDARRRPSTTL